MKGPLSACRGWLLEFLKVLPALRPGNSKRRTGLLRRAPLYPAIGSQRSP